jgi:hypothetical protein
MIASIFAGPSLARVPAELTAGFDMRGPARQGDVYRAALRRPAIIGLIDGYFEAVPSVWHKEILWALSHGIHVYGSASIGALRAVELEPFGMRGVGRVFEAYRDGVLFDDDEVALLHGPAEVGYLAVTEAMVNVRATSAKAVAEGVTGPAEAESLCTIAKSMFYKERTYPAILYAASGKLSAAALSDFTVWLPNGRIDQKRLDAMEMLTAIAAHVAGQDTRTAVNFTLAPTLMWESARHKIDLEAAS